MSTPREAEKAQPNGFRPTPTPLPERKRGSPKRLAASLILLITIAFAAFVAVKYYPYVFARMVDGEIIDVERVNQGTAILSGRDVPTQQLFSFALAIRDRETGEIVTASSEDRQWAVAHKGQCAKARFLRHPPWELEKVGTFFGARLVRLYDCVAK